MVQALFDRRSLLGVPVQAKSNELLGHVRDSFKEFEGEIQGSGGDVLKGFCIVISSERCESSE